MLICGERVMKDYDLWNRTTGKEEQSKSA